MSNEILSCPDALPQAEQQQRAGRSWRSTSARPVAEPVVVDRHHDDQHDRGDDREDHLPGHEVERVVASRPARRVDDEAPGDGEHALDEQQHPVDVAARVRRARADVAEARVRLAGEEAIGSGSVDAVGRRRRCRVHRVGASSSACSRVDVAAAARPADRSSGRAARTRRPGRTGSGRREPRNMHLTTGAAALRAEPGLLHVRDDGVRPVSLSRLNAANTDESFHGYDASPGPCRSCRRLASRRPVAGVEQLAGGRRPIRWSPGPVMFWASPATIGSRASAAWICAGVPGGANASTSTARLRST